MSSSVGPVEGGVVRVGLLGCGNVGAALVQLIEARADDITRRAGLRLELTRVAVRNLAKERPVAFRAGVVPDDAHSGGGDIDV